MQIDLAATVDGQAVEEAQTTGFSYQVGQGGLIDGIDEAITGLSDGESATFPTTLVAGEYKDREAEVTVTVTAVKERQLPEADDEFAQLASEFDTLDELTDDLRARLGRVRQMEQLTAARDKVLDAIVDATEIPLPEGILKSELDARMHDAIHPFDHDEAKFAEFLEENGKTREEFDTEAREDAEKSVRVRLVLDALADAQEVTVNDQELTERIIFQAQQYQMPPEEFVRRIQEAGQLGAIYSDVRRSKALIEAVRVATVTDPAGEPVDLGELLGDEDEGADESADEQVEAAAARAGRERRPGRSEACGRLSATPTANTAAVRGGGESPPRRVAPTQIKSGQNRVDTSQRQGEVTTQDRLIGAAMRRGGSPSSMTLSDSVYERLLQQRIIVLGQQVDDDIANRIAAQMLLLAAEDPTADIALYINSPGGSVTAGMAIFDTMEFIPCDVATYAMGLAASMGQFLLSAGARGKRYALPHCQILMHQPSAGVGGTESDISIQAELFRRHKAEMAQLIAGHTGQTVERIMTDFDRDRWFSAQEALEYGFVDHVISRAGQLPDAISENGNGSAR